MKTYTQTKTTNLGREVPSLVVFHSSSLYHQVPQFSIKLVSPVEPFSKYHSLQIYCPSLLSWSFLLPSSLLHHPLQHYTKLLPTLEHVLGLLLLFNLYFLLFPVSTLTFWHYVWPTLTSNPELTGRFREEVKHTHKQSSGQKRDGTDRCGPGQNHDFRPQPSDAVSIPFWGQRVKGSRETRR